VTVDLSMVDSLVFQKLLSRHTLDRLLYLHH